MRVPQEAQVAERKRICVDRDQTQKGRAGGTRPTPFEDKINREGVLKAVRNHGHYEKPSERRRRKMKIARFSARLSARYGDM
jgi:hypothetical protein